MQILFLDFDGVLHTNHSDAADHFCQRERFESAMREFPTVQIVIASTWREGHTLNEIREMLSQEEMRFVDLMYIRALGLAMLINAPLGQRAVHPNGNPRLRD